MQRVTGGRRRRQRPSRAELQQDGPPIRLSDLAVIVGFSRQKLASDAHAGHLRVQWQRCGTRHMGLVERHEALRYIGDAEAVSRSTHV